MPVAFKSVIASIRNYKLCIIINIIIIIHRTLVSHASTNIDVHITWKILFHDRKFRGGIDYQISFCPTGSWSKALVEDHQADEYHH